MFHVKHRRAPPGPSPSPRASARLCTPPRHGSRLDSLPLARVPDPCPSPPLSFASTFLSSAPRVAVRLAAPGTFRGSSPLPCPAPSFVPTFLSSAPRIAPRFSSPGPGRYSTPVPALGSSVLSSNRCAPAEERTDESTGGWSAQMTRHRTRGRRRRDSAASREETPGGWFGRAQIRGRGGEVRASHGSVAIAVWRTCTGVLEGS